MSRQDDTMPAENGSRRRGMVLVLVVFILGLVCGAALTIIGMRSVGPRRSPGGPDGRRAEMGRGFERMANELDLSDDQRRAIREIFQRSREEMHQITKDSGEDIRELLTEEQREKFDQMRERRGATEHRRRPGRGGRGKPPAPGDPLPPPPPE
jgi:uncharacterized membrane protein